MLTDGNLGPVKTWTLRYGFNTERLKKQCKNRGYHLPAMGGFVWKWGTPKIPPKSHDWSSPFPFFFQQKVAILRYPPLGSNPLGPRAPTSNALSLGAVPGQRCAWIFLMWSADWPMKMVGFETARFLASKKWTWRKEKSNHVTSAQPHWDSSESWSALVVITTILDPTRYETVINAMPTSSTKRWTLETMEIILEITSFRSNWGSRPFVLQPVPVGYRYSAGEQKMGSSLGRSCCSFSKNLAKGVDQSHRAGE